MQKKKDLDQWLWQVGAELQRLSAEMSPAAPKIARRGGWCPPVDVLVAEDRVIIKAELAGMRGHEIKILFDPEREVVVIRGTRQEEDLPDGYRRAHQLEIVYGEFVREVTLPEGDWNVSQSEAVYGNGYLIVSIPAVRTPDTVVIKRTIAIKLI